MSQSRKNMLLLSGSQASGNLADGEESGFLDFAEDWIKEHFASAVASNKPVLFVPYARPGGTSEEKYFNVVRDRFAEMGIDVICASPEGLTEKDFKNAGGIFIGGGHTYTLLDKLRQHGGLDLLRQKIEEGLPYMGSSAGTLITCATIKTTNDMPGPAHDIIDTRALGLIGTQLNCHYMDNVMHDPRHHGETRDTRIREFCAFNPGQRVFGLYEGLALRVEGDQTHVLVSERHRGTRTPVFVDGTRTEIECKPSTRTDVSALFKVQKPSAPARHQAPRPPR